MHILGTLKVLLQDEFQSRRKIGNKTCADCLCFHKVTMFIHFPTYFSQLPANLRIGR